MGVELRPDVVGHLALQVAHLVRQAASTQRSREALLDRSDHAWRPVARPQRIRQAAPPHVLEELAAARRVFLGVGRDVQQRLLAVRQNAPRRQHRVNLILQQWIAAILPRPSRRPRLSSHDSRRLSDEPSPAKVLADG